MNLDIAEKIFSIIGSLSIGVAVFTYFYQKKQDKTLAAINQITFFREKIIYEWSDVCSSIKEKNPKYWFSRIEINQHGIEEIKNKFSKNFENQSSLFLDIQNLQVSGPILDRQIHLLNMMEEFSLRVNHYNTQDHPALNSVHFTFVELVEKNAVALFWMRDIITGNPVYSITLSLYHSWKDRVGKTNVILNLEKHGFITKEQKKKIFESKRENTKSN